MPSLTQLDNNVSTHQLGISSVTIVTGPCLEMRLIRMPLMKDLVWSIPFTGCSLFYMLFTHAYKRTPHAPHLNAVCTHMLHIILHSPLHQHTACTPPPEHTHMHHISMLYARINAAHHLPSTHQSPHLSQSVDFMHASGFSMHLGVSPTTHSLQ